MSFRFATQKLNSGLYEPEGIYLQTPFEGEATVGVGWGEQTEHYGQYTYHGIPLKGHNGIDFIIPRQTKIIAADSGRVIEIGVERGGYERYLKLEHRWGESFYAFLNEIMVESGQIITRGAPIALAGREISFFHFSIRIEPFNHLDGFGGFSDPLPFLNPTDIQFSEALSDSVEQQGVKHKMVFEKPNARRP